MVHSNIFTPYTVYEPTATKGQLRTYFFDNFINCAHTGFPNKCITVHGVWGVWGTLKCLEVFSSLWKYAPVAVKNIQKCVMIRSLIAEGLKVYGSTNLKMVLWGVYNNLQVLPTRQGQIQLWSFLEEATQHCTGQWRAGWRGRVFNWRSFEDRELLSGGNRKCKNIKD